MRIYIEPNFRGDDQGEGGIRRVVDAQRRWLPQYGFEIVESIAEADLVASHAGNLPDVPVDKPWVVHTHGLYWAEYDWPQWAYSLNRKVIEAMRRADHVTAPSEWVAQALRRGMWLNPTILRHGIEPNQWEGGSNGDYVLWNKTRVDPICDPQPVNEVAAKMPDVRFVTTFGDKATNVQLTGRLPFESARDLILHAGVYLCTSRETMGIGTLEAMAAGVPVVGWRWGGQAEFIRHKETGWLCDPGDYDGLVDGIRWALANHDTVGRRAQQETQDRWSWQKVMANYADLYQLLQACAVGQRAHPKVSVIMPCYKLAQYLPDAIKSVQSQTMKDWELIIVDDASPDETANIASDFILADSRIRLVKNPKNLYLAGSLNRGIEASVGEYILPLDADNMIASRTLEALSEALDRDRGIHIAYGACQFVKEDGKTPDDLVSIDGVSRWPTDFNFGQQMLHRNQIPSTCMYRREAWERTGGYRVRCRTAEDAEMWTRASSLGFVPRKVTGAVTLIYRQREGSMSRAEADWDWTAWFPWARDIKLTPFGAACAPPAKVGVSWPVLSCEPPKVAIIIAVGLGHEGLVIDALDSVEAQTYRAWECIVINDTGKPLKIPHIWAKVFNTEGKRGPAAARNLGLTYSKSPWFVPLDADDYLQPDALEKFLEAAKPNTVVYSQWWDDWGKESHIYDPPEYDPKLLVSKGCLHAVTALYPRSAWEDVGGFDSSMRSWEDWDFQLLLAAKGVCSVKINKPLFTYRKLTGFRREENYSAFEKGKEAILKKWGKLWKGEEELMACGGCGRKTSTPPVINRNNGGGKPMNGATLLEYTGQNESTMTFKGNITGTLYRFGGNAGHRRKYVHAADAPHFLAIRGQFREVPPEIVAIKEMPRLEIKARPEKVVEPVLAAVAAESKPQLQATSISETKTIESSQAPPLQSGQAEIVLSVKRLREALPSMTKEALAVTLAKERAGENRKSAIDILERALRDA